MTFKTLLLLSSLLVFSCETTNDDGPGKQPDQIPFSVPATSIPADQSDGTALNVKNLVESVTSAQFALVTVFLNDQQNYNWIYTGDSFRYTITNQGLTFTYEIFEPQSEGGLYSIQFRITGNFNGVAVVDFIALDGSWTADGSQGNFDVYDLDSNDSKYRAVSYSWNTILDDVSFSYKLYDESGTTTISTDITVSTDGSGTYAAFAGGVLLQSATWNADGSGSFTTYDQFGAVITTTNWT